VIPWAGRSNKRLERTCHNGIFNRRLFGEPLKRGVGLLLVFNED